MEERHLQEALGRVIAMQRRRVEMSQVDLARSTGLGKSTVERIEQGLRDANVAQLGAIARTLGVTMSALIAEAERGDEAGLPIGVAREVADLKRRARPSE